MIKRHPISESGRDNTIVIRLSRSSFYRRPCRLYLPLLLSPLIPLYNEQAYETFQCRIRVRMFVSTSACASPSASSDEGSERASSELGATTMQIRLHAQI